MVENPQGLCGFEFIDFGALEPNDLKLLFETIGFGLLARHRSKDGVHYRPAGIHFMVTREPKSANCDALALRPFVSTS
ncbi:MAG: hypothetical protein EBT08_03320 [Betaproteobacteria bacterium]|nr:hypothetical protein [Betaproteobacteria bacterium]